MAEPKSIILSAVVVAVGAAAGLFFVLLAPDNGQPEAEPTVTPISDVVDVASLEQGEPVLEEEIAIAEEAMTAEEEQEVGPRPEVAGAQDVAATADTGSTEITLLLTLLLTGLGLLGVWRLSWSP